MPNTKFNLKNSQIIVTFCQSGEISPNLVTLNATQREIEKDINGKIAAKELTTVMIVMEVVANALVVVGNRH